MAVISSNDGAVLRMIFRTASRWAEIKDHPDQAGSKVSMTGLLFNEMPQGLRAERGVLRPEQKTGAPARRQPLSGATIFSFAGLERGSICDEMGRQSTV